MSNEKIECPRCRGGGCEYCSGKGWFYEPSKPVEAPAKAMAGYVPSESNPYRCANCAKWKSEHKDGEDGRPYYCPVGEVVENSTEGELLHRAEKAEREYKEILDLHTYFAEVRKGELARLERAEREVTRLRKVPHKVAEEMRYMAIAAKSNDLVQVLHAWADRLNPEGAGDDPEKGSKDREGG